MVTLHFNFKDLFRAGRIAFSLQRVWINFFGLAVGYGLYMILTYLSFLAASNSFLAMWDRYGIFPCLFGGGNFPWYSWAIFIVGLLLLVLFVLLTNTAVSRAVYMNLKGETFYTWKESFKFAFKNIASILGAPVAIAGVMIMFAVGALFMGLIGKIPYAGELITSAMTLFYMGGGLFVFFLGLVLIIAFILVPSIIATTDEDGFEAVFQSFSLATGQPVRLLTYLFIVCVIELLAFCLMAFSVKEAWFIYSDLFAISMGDKFNQIGQQAMYYAQYTLAASRPWIDYYFQDLSGVIYFSRDFVPVADLSGLMKFCSYLFAFFLLMIGGLVVAYAEATGNAGLTLMYLIMRQKHDGENLLERKEEDEEFETEGTTSSEDTSTEDEGQPVENTSSDDTSEETAFCVKCKETREIVDPKKVTMKNGHPAMKGKCPVCGSGLYRILPSK